MFRPKGFKFKPEYVALSVGAALILFVCIVIPRFSSYLNVTRFYHICLFLLAPLLVVGGEVIWHSSPALAGYVSSRIRVKRKPEPSSLPGALATKQPENAQVDTTNNASSPAYLRFLALAILILYFLFNSGFIFEVSGSQLYGVNDLPSSLALSSYKLDMPIYNQKKADAANWLAERIDDDILVYADEYDRLLLYDRLFGQVGVIPDNGEVPEDAYIFLRTWNVERRELNIIARQGVQVKHEHVSLSDLPGLLEGRKLIFDNGAAQIWAPR